MRTRQPRGSALILSIIVILVMSVLAVGMIRYAQAEVAGATGGAKREALVMCAEAARNLLLTRFHALGTPPTSITPINAALDGTNGQVLAVGGHMDTVNVTLGQVTALGDDTIGGAATPTSIANNIPLLKLGGTPLKVMVHCQIGGDGTPTSGRQMELEYGLRFGL